MLRDALGRLGARLLAHGAARQGKRRLAEAAAVAAEAPGGRAYLSSARLYSAHPAQLLEEELLPDTSGEERAQAELAAHNQLVTQLTLLHHQVRSQNIVQPGYFVPRNVLADAYYTPVRLYLDGLDAGGGLTEAQLAVRARWLRQLDAERSALVRSVERYLHQMAEAKARGSAAELPPGRGKVLEWFGPLVEAIRAEQEAIGAQEVAMDRRKYGPLLLCLPPEPLAVITLHVVLSALLAGARGSPAAGVAEFDLGREAGSTKVMPLVLQIGRAVQNQVSLDNMRQKAANANQRGKAATQALQEAGLVPPAGVDLTDVQRATLGGDLSDLPDLPLDLRNWLLGVDGGAEARLQALRKRHPKPSMVKLLKRVRSRMSQCSMWDKADMCKIGAVLVHMLMETAEIVPYPRDALGRVVEEPELAPALAPVKAFWRRTEFQADGRRTGTVYCHDEVLRQVSAAEEGTRDAMMPQFMPMVVPARPWTHYDRGGHLLSDQEVVRLHGNAMQREALKTADALPLPQRAISQVYSALDMLGQVGWRINAPMHAAVEAAWAAGGGVCELPSAADLPALPPPGAPRFRTVSTRRGQLLVTNTAAETPTEAFWRRLANARVKKKNRELHSLRCDTNLKLGVAREVADEEAFYFPHSLDFRGRAYPMHPHLNHLGNDLCRGVLSFAEARPLGRNGLGWLYVQIANSFGNGVDKLAFHQRQEHVQERLNLVLDSAERPFEGARWWQSADAPWQCLAACMEVRDALASGDPAAFRSRLPVQMDGSCNGLQHYAALSRDAPGAHAVNLLPVDRPQDVYSGIAALVRERVEREAGEGRAEARALVGNIDRKLVKQTVMTSVYGVTYVGARSQIGARLRDRGWENDSVIFRASSYGARITLDALGTMFSKAKDVMNWLTACARVVASSGEPVSWHTPLGLPIVQPYRRKDVAHVVTVLQRLVLRTTKDSPVDRTRQASAFPPNYIHCIDSSHMMLTALACKRNGLAFAGVHDSFWTHAGTVDDMNRLLREAFVELHSRPLLQELAAEMQERHPDVVIPPVPELGTLDLRQVLHAPYFFS